eukprot:scaffold117914_cov36-Tisochrysis_lutea.AAC.6
MLNPSNRHSTTGSPTPDARSLDKIRELNDMIREIPEARSKKQVQAIEQGELRLPVKHEDRMTKEFFRKFAKPERRTARFQNYSLQGIGTPQGPKEGPGDDT